jgi:hypothetical protein
MFKSKYFNQKYGIQWIEPYYPYRLRFSLENSTVIENIKFKHIIIFILLIILIGLGLKDNIFLINQSISNLITLIITVLLAFLITIIIFSSIFKNADIILLNDCILVMKAGSNLEIIKLINFNSYEILSGKFDNREYNAIKLKGDKSKVLFLDKNDKIEMIKDRFNKIGLIEAN